jgi:hypothetical protein
MLELLKRLLSASKTRVNALLEALRNRYGRGREAEKPLVLGNDLASRIVRAMVRKGYRVDASPGHVTIVYVEGMNPSGSANENRPSQFNDVRVCIAFEGRTPRIIGLWEATTEPSRYWTQRPMNPKGAARIKFGQHTAWRVGVHRHDHEALVQVRPVTVCRDLNKDFERRGDKEDTGLFGINQHWGYDLPLGDLGTSSAGCLVGRTRAGHRAFMAIVKSDPRYRDDDQFVFTTTILPASDVTNA